MVLVFNTKTVEAFSASDGHRGRGNDSSESTHVAFLLCFTMADSDRPSKLAKEWLRVQLHRKVTARVHPGSIVLEPEERVLPLALALVEQIAELAQAVPFIGPVAALVSGVLVACEVGSALHSCCTMSKNPRPAGSEGYKWRWRQFPVHAYHKSHRRSMFYYFATAGKKSCRASRMSPARSRNICWVNFLSLLILVEETQ